MTVYTPKTEAQLTVVSGPAACGKTTELLARVRALLAGGADPADVLVLAPSATAADALRDRLGARLADVAGARDVRVTTPVDVALGILGTPEAFAATGRRAHVLTEAECIFFLQDMLVMGKRNRRLGEMLKFLERGWSELREDDDDWLVTIEEREVNDFAASRLAFYEALHPAQVTATAVRYLAHAPRARQAARTPHVLVDDARSMSRASQVLAATIAAETLTVAWDDNAALVGAEPYAYDDGKAELLAANEGARVVRLDACHASVAVREALGNVLAQPAFGAGVVRPQTPAVGEDVPAGAVRELSCPLLDDEMAQVVAAVTERLDAGEAPEDLFVACSTDAWARRVRTALGAAGVAASVVDGRQPVGGNVRDANRNLAERVYHALALVADPDSAIAWRCWCGYGEYLTCSTAFAAMLDEARATGGTLLGCLRALAADPAAAEARGSEFAHVLRAYRDGLGLIKAVRGLTGQELLAAIARQVASAPVPAAVAGLLGDVAPDETAAALYARAQRALLDPTFAPGTVRVGGIEQLVGQRPATIVFAGMVNGLVPTAAYFDLTKATVDEQAKMRARLVRRLYAAAGCARREILCSTFRAAVLEQAEALHLDATRLRLVGGRRVSQLSPSVCVGYLTGTMTAEA